MTRQTLSAAVLPMLLCGLSELPVPAIALAVEKSPRQIELKVLPGDKVLASGKHQFTLDAFPARLQRAMQTLSKSGIAPKQCVAVVTADDKATHGQWKRVIEICQEQGIEKFLLKFEQDHHVELKPAAHREGLPADRELLPFIVQVQAKPDGSVAMVKVDRLAVESFEALQREFITRIGDERGPGSLADTAQVEIDADDELLMQHVAQAYNAVAGYRNREGDLIALIKNVGPPRGGEEIEILEEFEEIEFEEFVEGVEEIEDFGDFEVIEQPQVEVANDPDVSIVPVPQIEPLDLGLTVEARPLESAKPARPDLAARERLAKVKKYGGSEASEKAVALGLQWIASRQPMDGGWNFNHNLTACKPCPNPGSAEKARNGATGLALLPLLAAGYTHQEGKYKREVTAGLKYLIKNMQVKDRAGSWSEPEGTMYSHGFAALAMCEAYAKTSDKDLLAPAQLAVNYISSAQDPKGGGWRYTPRQAGDTSVTAVQILALKQAHSGYLAVPKDAVLGSIRFLDSVQADKGAQYGYTAPAEGRAATNAMGLLCRSYLGWKHDHDALVRGIAQLDKQGPSKANMYYNYYATQVMFHYGGEPWQRWNARVRDQIVKSQDTKSDAAHGSWFVAGDHGSARGGRLYCTALACLILETYYRQPPIYEKEEDEEFPL